MEVTYRMSEQKPDYALAGTLLPVIQKFYEDPENEKAYQEWLKDKEKRPAVASCQPVH